jgi:hypothetical protein
LINGNLVIGAEGWHYMYKTIIMAMILLIALFRRITNGSKRNE